MQINAKSQVYAGFFVRLAAFLVDMIIINAGLAVVRFPLWLWRMKDADNFLFRSLIFQYSVKDILFYLLTITYFVLLTYYTGSTLGKKLFALRVISVEERKMTFFEVVYRESIGRFLSGVICNLGYLLILAQKEHRGVHDLLSDTCVIYYHEKKVYVHTQMNYRNMAPQPGYTVPPDVTGNGNISAGAMTGFVAGNENAPAGGTTDSVPRNENASAGGMGGFVAGSENAPAGAMTGSVPRNENASAGATAGVVSGSENAPVGATEGSVTGSKDASVGASSNAATENGETPASHSSTGSAGNSNNTPIYGGGFIAAPRHQKDTQAVEVQKQEPEEQKPYVSRDYFSLDDEKNSAEESNE